MVITEKMGFGVAKSGSFFVGSGLCAPRSWSRVKIRMWSKLSPTPPPPLPTPRPGRLGGAPLQIIEPMGTLHPGPHLPYAAVVAACRVEGLGAARPWRGAALIEGRGMHLAVPLYLHAGQDMSPFDRPVHVPRQILIYTSHSMCLHPRPASMPWERARDSFDLQ